MSFNKKAPKIIMNNEAADLSSDDQYDAYEVLSPSAA